MKPLLALPAPLILLAVGSPACAQKRVEPVFSHAFEVKVRPAKEATFEVHRYHIEAYKDPEARCGLYVCQTGHLAVFPALHFDSTKTKPAEPLWHVALEFPVRPPGVMAFERGKRWSVETYHDVNTAVTLYVAETGAVAARDAKPDKADKMFAPDWLLGLDLRAREPDFEAKPIRVGAELYRDRNVKSLVYVTQHGGVAVSAENAKIPAPDSIDWIYGMILKTRRHDEPDFNPRTKQWGVEVFRDGAGNLVYVCESGNIGVTPNRKDLRKPPARPKPPELSHALILKARRAGEKEFTKETRLLGVECFRDLEADNLLYITDAGALAVVPIPAR